ncbi:hypothetical protein DO71_1987 [Burkholderia pseudomallei]|nr:hypothetical protein DO71_1987 [Burkholderia pseudomallei]KGD13211.1 hypothetical protein DO70_3300 [Burkholderia pseudomallei]
MREEVVTRATPLISTAADARGRPCRSTTSACTGTRWPTDTQWPAWMPATTAAGHSIASPRIVCTSPFGSANVASSATRLGASTAGRPFSVSAPEPVRSSVSAILSAMSFVASGSVSRDAFSPSCVSSSSAVASCVCGRYGSKPKSG